MQRQEHIARGTYNVWLYICHDIRFDASAVILQNNMPEKPACILILPAYGSVTLEQLAKVLMRQTDRWAIGKFCRWDGDDIGPDSLCVALESDAQVEQICGDLDVKTAYLRKKDMIVVLT